MSKPCGGLTRRECADRTRRKLLDTALDLFRERGFDATSLETIVRAVGVTKGAFYANFKSKTGLICEYLETLDMDYRNRYSKMPADRDAAATLADFADAVIEIMETRLPLNLLRVVYRAEVSREIPLDPFLSPNRELYRIVAEILERGKREGSFRPDLDSARAAGHVVVAIRGMVFEWCSRSPGFDIHKELAEHMELIANGLRS